MKIKEILKVLDAELLAGEENLEMDIEAACGSDLMSDVMAYVKDNVLMLTGLVNLQVVRTAEMMDIKAIVFVRGKKPDNSIIALAREKGIAVMTTKNPMFTACGKLYSAGITGKGVWD
ncbi:MAG: DRTGG domain-containing protein [Clostridia bacterium]|nr:DRTGG domain-containing protein [Clostridia bacterium]